MDRILLWNSAVNGGCVLCQTEEETSQHLFFQCQYSGKVWRDMVGGILQDDYTTSWDDIIEIISQVRRCPTETFILRYAFQALAHSTWRERNARKHGEQPLDERTLAKMVDKTVRLKLLLVCEGERYEIFRRRPAEMDCYKTLKRSPKGEGIRFDLELSITLS